MVIFFRNHSSASLCVSGWCKTVSVWKLLFCILYSPHCDYQHSTTCTYSSVCVFNPKPHTCWGVSLFQKVPSKITKPQDRAVEVECQFIGDQYGLHNVRYRPLFDSGKEWFCNDLWITTIMFFYCKNVDILYKTEWIIILIIKSCILEPFWLKKVNGHVTEHSLVNYLILFPK